MYNQEQPEVKLYQSEPMRKSIVKSSYRASIVHSPIKPKPKPPRILAMRDFKKFKYIANITCKYTLGSVLGQGSFGVVRKCTLIDTGLSFAIKSI